MQSASYMRDPAAASFSSGHMMAVMPRCPGGHLGHSVVD